jgi:hypothetical protein
MGQPAAKQGDQVVGTDTHIIRILSPGGPVPTPLPHLFTGMLDGSLSTDAKIMGMAAAVVGSTATNTPPHILQGGPFRRRPPIADHHGQRDRAHQRQAGGAQRRHR